MSSPCNDISVCNWSYCKENKRCLLWFNSLSKSERMGIMGWKEIEKNKNKKAKKKNKTASIHVTYKLSEKKIKILNKTNGKCWLCNKKIINYEEFSIDHVIPTSKGGHKTKIENLMAAHRKCNSIKSDHDIKSHEDFMELLKTKNK